MSRIQKEWNGLQVDVNGAVLDFYTGEIGFKGALPGITLLEGNNEEKSTVQPVGNPIVQTKPRLTPMGLSQEYAFHWMDPRGYCFGWMISLLQDRPGFTVREAFYNGSQSPVRIHEFILCRTRENGMVCKGNPADWWLSTLSHATRIGNLGEILPSVNEETKSVWQGFGMPIPFELPADERSNDGKWRVYEDFLTLYTELGRKGVCLSAVGQPEAFLRFDCKVDQGNLQMDAVCEMNDVRVEPGQWRSSQEMIILAQPYRPAVEGILRWIAASHGSRTQKGPVFGWCSWYDLGAAITQESVAATIEAFAGMKDRIAANVIQIDDGYQKQAGDWAWNSKFMRGPQAMVERTRETGAMPGIWLAPLAVHESTGLIEEHPEWFQKDAAGSFTGEANNWGPKSRWLDPTHPGVQDFLRKIIREKKKEGFSYFKIDFNNLEKNCRFENPYKTRLQTYRDLYRLYREEIGEEGYLLSCSSFTRGTMGYADASRIGPDSCPIWRAAHPCTLIEAIRATGMSALANGIVYANDPDVTYTLPRGQHDGSKCEDWEKCNPVSLTMEEWQTWHSMVGLLGGAALVSEPMHKPRYMNTVRMLEILNPPSPEKGYSLHGGTDGNHRRFGFTAHRSWGSHASVLLWNPEDAEMDMEIGTGELEMREERFHIWSFWDGRYYGLGDVKTVLRNIPPHGCKLLRLTEIPADCNLPVLVGSDLHIGMGTAEISDYRVTDSEIAIRLTDAGAREGCLYVYCPSRLDSASISTRNCSIDSVTRMDADLWKITISGRKQGTVQEIELSLMDQ